MENIIKKAIEGGYKYNEDEDVVATLFLDPLFWQALGKACGWKKYIWLSYPMYHFDNLARKHFTDDEDFSPDTREGTDTPYAARYITWQHYAHCFYEINLTEGWDKAVEYLNNLIKQ